MQQIADWLEKLGMSEYVQRFAENGITAEALRHLTDQDLKDIGVLLGHRRIMLGGYWRPCWRTTSSAETSHCSGAKGARCRRATAGHGDVL
jgi:hypothetical protein